MTSGQSLDLADLGFPPLCNTLGYDKPGSLQGSNKRTKNQNALQIEKLSVWLDIIIVADIIDPAGPEKACGILGGPEPTLVPGMGWRAGTAASTQIRPHLHSTSPSCVQLSQTAGFLGRRASS